MKILIGWFMIFFFAASVYAAEVYVNDDRLPELSKPRAVLYFHADWCPYCKKFLPTWNAVVNNPANQGLAIFVRINSDTAKMLMKKFNIKGVPTLLIFHQSGGKEVIEVPRNPFTRDFPGASYRPWNPEEFKRFAADGTLP